jgi:hypothetical protein
LLELREEEVQDYVKQRQRLSQDKTITRKDNQGIRRQGKARQGKDGQNKQYK